MGAKASSPESNASDYSTAVKAIDGRCILSGELSRLHSCHLVPETEANWVRCEVAL